MLTRVTLEGLLFVAGQLVDVITDRQTDRTGHLSIASDNPVAGRFQCINAGKQPS